MIKMKKLFAVLLNIVVFCNLFGVAAFASDGDAQRNAVEITEYDKIYYGTISEGGQNDWYKITTGSKDAYYYFMLNNETGSSGAYLVVYNDRDVELLKTNYTGKGQSTVGNVKLDPDTAYYVKVYMDGSGIGNYSVEVSYKEDEVPDESENAVEVVKDTMYYQSIDGYMDYDWYVLQTDSSAEYYYFYLKNESCQDYVYMKVFNERDAGVLNVGNGTYAGRETTGNVKLEPNAKYYFVVYVNNNTIGNYTFQITSKADDVGDDKESASEIEPNQLVSSSIDGSGDVDFFVFKTGNTTREYQLIFNNETGTTNGHVIVYTARDEKLLDVGNYTGAGESASGTITLNADSTYYFKVYLNDTGVGSYSFKLTQCVNGHTPSGSWTTTVEPDCLTNGEKAKVCTVCGETVEVERVKALGHDFSNKEVIEKATWISLGSKKATCSRCGEVEYSKDWSKVWILPVIILGGIVVLIGIINYARAFSRRRY